MLGPKVNKKNLQNEDDDDDISDLTRSFGRIDSDSLTNEIMRILKSFSASGYTWLERTKSEHEKNSQPLSQRWLLTKDTDSSDNIAEITVHSNGRVATFHHGFVPTNSYSRWEPIKITDTESAQYAIAKATLLQRAIDIVAEAKCKASELEQEAAQLSDPSQQPSTQRHTPY